MAFNSFQVSTKTFIVYTNIILKIEELFTEKVLPITDYVVVLKKRGRKKKQQEEDPNKDIQNGSIIRVQYKKDYHGVILKSKAKGFFRNAMTIVMMVDGKLINFKATRNGKFQMTGCKTDEQAEKCIMYFWTYIKHRSDLYDFTNNGTHLIAYYNPVMYNIDFSLGFQVNRENLDIYINTKTPYTSLLQTTFGYTGVNIKMPVMTDRNKLSIMFKEYMNEGTKTSYIPFGDFSIKFSDDIVKKKYNTFLVFQSGRVIMSGKSAVFMENPYYEFIDIINTCKPIVMEVIDPVELHNEDYSAIKRTDKKLYELYVEPDQLQP